MNATLRITDGTTHVDLIRGAYRLLDWTPLVSQAKDGGRFTDSPLADGRRLRDFKWDNVTESFTLQLNAACQDSAIEFTQTLRRLLVKAKDYWTTDWQDTPVYIQCRAPDETETRYSLIVVGSLEEDANYFNQPFTAVDFLGNVVMDELPLTLERGHWTGNKPETGVCVEVSGEYDLDVVAGGYTTTWALESTIAGRNLQDKQDCIYTATNGDIFLLLKNWIGAGAYDGTIRRSVDNGATWNIVENQAAEGFSSIDNVTATILIASSHDAAQKFVYIWQSTDSGATWAKVKSINHGAYYAPSTVLTLANGDCICQVQGSSSPGVWEGMHIYRSANQGATWNFYTSIYTISTALPYAPPLIQLSSGRILSGGHGVWYSDNNGINWFEGTPGWIISMLQTRSGRCLAMQYLGSPQQLKYSDDDGATWASLASFGIPAYYILGLSQLTVSPYSIFIFQEGTSNVYISLDDGTSWTVDDDISADTFNGGLTIEDDGETVLAASCDYVTDDVHVYSRTVTGSFDDIDVTVGTEADCDGAAYLANKYLPYNITHIKQSTAIGYDDVFPMDPLPHDILYEWGPRCVYFGMVGDQVNLQPTFTNLVFDIDEACPWPGEYTIEWRYSDGGAGWPLLTAADHTDNDGGVFSQTGVECLSWEPPSDWAEELVDGDTGFWIRACITAYTGVLVHTVPTQQNRQIYTANLPYIDFDADQVTGDISAIMEVLLPNEGDKDGPGTTSSPRGYSNRIMLGTRSLGRGENFIAYLNASDELTPLSVSCEVGASTTFTDSLTAPAGRAAYYNPTGLEDLNPRVKWTIASIRSTEYHGTFHAFLRCFQSGGSPGDINVKLKFTSGSGGIDYETGKKTLSTLNDFYLMDFGRVDIPASAMIKNSEAGDELTIEVYADSVDGTPFLYIYDLILLPTDEWICDSKDAVGNDDSAIEWGKSLEIDSVTHSKATIRSLLRSGQSTSGLISSVYATDSTGPAVLLPDKDQRVWALAASLFVAEGVHDGAGNLAYLSDASGDFVNQGVKAGMTVINETDGSEAIITFVTATEIHGPLVGGTGNDWDAADVGHVITDNWVSWPWICHSIQMWNNQRYLAARGEN